jgi:hypothetical protein
MQVHPNPSLCSDDHFAEIAMFNHSQAKPLHFKLPFNETGGDDSKNDAEEEKE